MAIETRQYGMPSGNGVYTCEDENTRQGVSTHCTVVNDDRLHFDCKKEKDTFTCQTTTPENPTQPTVFTLPPSVPEGKLAQTLSNTLGRNLPSYENRPLKMAFAASLAGLTGGMSLLAGCAEGQVEEGYDDSGVSNDGGSSIPVQQDIKFWRKEGDGFVSIDPSNDRGLVVRHPEQGPITFYFSVNILAQDSAPEVAWIEPLPPSLTPENKPVIRKEESGAFQSPASLYSFTWSPSEQDYNHTFYFKLGLPISGSVNLDAIVVYRDQVPDRASENIAYVAAARYEYFEPVELRLRQSSEDASLSDGDVSSDGGISDGAIVSDGGISDGDITEDGNTNDSQVSDAATDGSVENDGGSEINPPAFLPFDQVVAVREGDEMVFRVRAVDPDQEGQELAVTLVDPQPGWTITPVADRENLDEVWAYEFRWQTTNEDGRDQPYPITFRVTDAVNSQLFDELTVNVTVANGPFDTDGDGFVAPADCAPNDATIHPLANGVNQINQSFQVCPGTYPSALVFSSDAPNPIIVSAYQGGGVMLDGSAAGLPQVGITIQAPAPDVTISGLSATGWQTVVSANNLAHSLTIENLNESDSARGVVVANFPQVNVSHLTARNMGEAFSADGIPNLTLTDVHTNAGENGIVIMRSAGAQLSDLDISGYGGVGLTIDESPTAQVSRASFSNGPQPSTGAAIFNSEQVVLDSFSFDNTHHALDLTQSGDLIVNGLSINASQRGLYLNGVVNSLFTLLHITNVPEGGIAVWFENCNSSLRNIYLDMVEPIGEALIHMPPDPDEVGNQCAAERDMLSNP